MQASRSISVRARARFTWLYVFVVVALLLMPVSGMGAQPLTPAAMPAAGDDFWMSGFNLPGISGTVRALLSDSSGMLYVAGEFSVAGGLPADNIAAWDGAAWQTLGRGIDGPVYALALDGAGHLYAGGRFIRAGDTSAFSVARWDGATWTPLSGGINGYVYALAVDGGGLLYAAGNFVRAGDVDAHNIARWDGMRWAPLGLGTDGWVYALAVDRSGLLYAGGWFYNAGQATSDSVACWDGTAWQNMGMLRRDGVPVAVLALQLDEDGSLYAGGMLRGYASAESLIAHYEGHDWSTLGSGLRADMGGISYVHALALDRAGNLYAGGKFTRSGEVMVSGVARWDGIAWSALGSGVFDPDLPSVYALTVDGAGNLVAGGNFIIAGEVGAASVARWQNATWSALGTGNGVDRSVRALAVDGAGNLYAGGSFQAAGTTTVNYIARFDGRAWSVLGNGIAGCKPVVWQECVGALAVDRAGRVYAGGDFSGAAGANANYIAVWDGSRWSALGSGLNGPVSALALDAAGRLYAGGRFSIAGSVVAHNIAVWDGKAWSALGRGLLGPAGTTVYALAVDSHGRLYAGGLFDTAGSITTYGIARWDGVGWSDVGGGMDSSAWVLALVVDDGDNLIAAGGFWQAGGVNVSRIARWNGITWSALGSGLNDNVRALALGPGGRLYAAGDFTIAGGGEANGVAAWDGVAWSALGSGLAGCSPTWPYDCVTSLAVDENDHLYAGGTFSTAGGRSSAHIAEWAPAVSEPTPTPTSTTAAPTATATHTATPAPTSTLTPTPSATATATPTLTPLRRYLPGIWQ